LSEAGRESEVRERWLRRGLASLWTFLFAIGGFAVASAWDQLVEGLLRAPVPAVSQAPPAGPRTSPGEQAIALARRRLDLGQPAEALKALLAIKPEEPVYPFSLQLRDEAERALKRTRGRSANR